LSHGGGDRIEGEGLDETLVSPHDGPSDVLPDGGGAGCTDEDGVTGERLGDGGGE